jgi:hypothetical protein
MVQSTIALVIILLHHTVSQTKLCPSLQVHTTSDYSQLLCYTLCDVRKSEQSKEAKVAGRKLMKLTLYVELSFVSVNGLKPYSNPY